MKSMKNQNRTANLKQKWLGNHFQNLFHNNSEIIYWLLRVKHYVYKGKLHHCMQIAQAMVVDHKIWISDVDHMEQADPFVSQHCITCFCSLSLKRFVSYTGLL
jgi:hypothetical protein